MSSAQLVQQLQVWPPSAEGATDAVWCVQLLLLTKAVLVALYGADGLLPHGRHAGLLLLFAPILSCAGLMAAQHLALGAYIAGAPALGMRALVRQCAALSAKQPENGGDWPASPAALHFRRPLWRHGCTAVHISISWRCSRACRRPHLWRMQGYMRLQGLIACCPGVVTSSGLAAGRERSGPHLTAEEAPLLPKADALKAVDKAPVGTLVTLLHLMAPDTMLLIVAFLAGVLSPWDRIWWQARRLGDRPWLLPYGSGARLSVPSE